MAAPTLRDLVKANLPETWKVLETDPEPPLVDEQRDSGTDDVPEEAIGRIIDRYFKPEVTREILEGKNRFVKGVLADMATRLLITAAIDYYMVRTRTGDSASATNVEGVGGDTSQNYDRVRGLRDLDKDIALRIAADMAEFLAQVTDLLEIETEDAGSWMGPRVSTRGTGFKTQGTEGYDRIDRPIRRIPGAVW